MKQEEKEIAGRLDFKKLDGLIPVIIQDHKTHAVRMLGFMNKAAVEKTLTKGVVTFYSRTKKRLWTKGEISGNTQKVMRIEVDCDNDTLLIHVRQKGSTCHTGEDTCFNTQIQ